MMLSGRGRYYWLLVKKRRALAKSLQDPLDGSFKPSPIPSKWEKETVFLGGNPFPVASVMQTHPSMTHWLDGGGSENE